MRYILMMAILLVLSCDDTGPTGTGNSKPTVQGMVIGSFCYDLEDRPSLPYVEHVGQVPTLKFTRSNGRVYEVTVDSASYFSIVLPVDTYQVSIRSRWNEPQEVGRWYVSRDLTRDILLLPDFWSDTLEISFAYSAGSIPLPLEQEQALLESLLTYTGSFWFAEGPICAEQTTTEGTFRRYCFVMGQDDPVWTGWNWAGSWLSILVDEGFPDFMRLNRTGVQPCVQ